MLKLKIIVVAILIIPLISRAQLVKKTQVGFSVGNQGVYCENPKTPSNLNFLNYIYTDNFTGELLYIAFSGNFEFSNNIFANAVVGMYSDLAPVKYNFAFSYLPWENIGIGASFLGYSQYVDDFNQFHWENDTGMFADLDLNYRQQKMYNMGLAIGPELRYENSWFTGNIRTQLGLRWVSELNTNIVQKEINGNYKRMFTYAVGKNPNLYLFPEIELRFRLFSLSKSTLGIKVRAAAEYSKRTLNYRITTYEWTTQSSSTENISLAPSAYRSFETDFGLFFEW